MSNVEKLTIFHLSPIRCQYIEKNYIKCRYQYDIINQYRQYILSISYNHDVNPPLVYRLAMRSVETSAYWLKSGTSYYSVTLITKSEIPIVKSAAATPLYIVDV